jgi:hypothetical protein
LSQKPFGPKVLAVVVFTLLTDFKQERMICGLFCYGDGRNLSLVTLVVIN